MAVPKIHTYHCLCTSLLLASTHTLSSLPRRQSPSLDHALILPLPSSPPTNANPSPSPSPSRSPSPSQAQSTSAEQTSNDSKPEVRHPTKQEKAPDLPSEGYTVLLSMVLDRRATLIRREDGFEKRLLWRCGRCRLVVGYELVSEGGGGEAMDVDGHGVGKGRKGEEDLKVIYLLPAGIMSTEVMMGKGKRAVEEDVDLLEGAVATAFE